MTNLRVECHAKSELKLNGLKRKRSSVSIVPKKDGQEIITETDLD